MHELNLYKQSTSFDLSSFTQGHAYEFQRDLLDDNRAKGEKKKDLFEICSD